MRVRIRASTMAKPKYAAQIGNIFFLTRIGSTLRWATDDIAREELPPEIQHLLRRLERLEKRAEQKPDGIRQE
jgi:hypothetical protein